MNLDVTLELTRKCPLRCIFCSSNGGFPHPNELQLNDWKKIVDESIDLGTKSFLISGGEPFTSSYLFDLIDYIQDKNIDLSIYSSGNIKENYLEPISIKHIEKIASYGKIRMVISLEAAEEALHDRITQRKNSYRNTITTIKNCIDLDLPVELHFVPTKLNYTELPKLVELAKSLQVRKLSVLRFVPQGRGYENKDELILNHKELIQLRSIFLGLEKYGDFVRIGSPFNSFLLSKQYKCTAATDRITIRYDGLVAPCEAFKFILERYQDDVDLRKRSLRDIWSNSKLFSDVREYKKIFSDVHSKCYNCSYFSRCGGGCPAQKILNGSLLNVDPICVQKLQESINI